MDFLSKLEEMWVSLRVYKTTKELLSDFRGNEKRRYLRCILKWAASGDNQDRANYWLYSDAVTYCCQSDKSINNEEVMKHTFGLIEVYGLGEVPDGKDKVRFNDKGIGAGRIFGKIGWGTLFLYEGLLNSVWLVFAFAVIALYLDVMAKIGVMDDVKALVINSFPFLKSASALVLIFLTPAMTLLICNVITTFFAVRIFKGD